MSKKKWLLLLLSLLLLAACFKLFYKTYNESTVCKSADKIIAIDTKRIINSFIWQTISNPGRWKIKNSLSSADQIGWQDMVELPDFVFVFHVAQQPENVYYTVFYIKDEEAFSKVMLQYHFTKKDSHQGMTEYAADSSGLSIIRQGKHLLIANVAAENSQLIWLTANEMFVNKSFISKSILQQTVAAKSHIAYYIPANDFLSDTAIVRGNFDDEKFEISCSIRPKPQFVFTEGAFNFSNTSMCEIGFALPSANLYQIVPPQIKSNLSKAAGFALDSLIAINNASFSLDISGIQSKTDSAISYSYDEDFNKVEKVVLNNILEPSLHFYIRGDSLSKLYNYWKNNQKLEPTPAGNLFVLMPFVKSYCRLENEKELSVTSYNYQQKQQRTAVKSVCYLNIDVNKLPVEVKNYIPEETLKMLANIESAKFTANKEGQMILVNLVISKKKNDLPLIEF